MRATLSRGGEERRHGVGREAYVPEASPNPRGEYINEHARKCYTSARKPVCDPVGCG